MEGLQGTVLGNFHLVEAIGQGGMTTVYRAVRMDDGREVAVKVLSPYIAQDPNFKNRFEREIEVLLRVSHPRIVPILDYGEVKSFAYIVMPYFASGTLQDRLDAGPLDPLEGARIVEDVSQALQHAHQQGVVHRDVKPSNVILDQDGNAYLSDFGFAQVGDVSLNLTGSALIGTPAFMSPEQCQGKAIDPRSDQYSLGVMLYQISTGSLPFEGETPMAIAVKHINEPLPRPRRVNPHLPARIENILLKALAKEPQDRYSDIAELNRVFQSALAESLDESGNFIPDPRRFEVATWVMEDSPLAGPLSGLGQLWSNQRGLALVLLFLLLALPTAGFALSAMSPDPDPQDSSTIAQNVQATIDALSTRIAADMGSRADTASIAAAVAATLNASLPESSRIVGLMTPTFDVSGALAFQPTATPPLVVVAASPTKAKEAGGPASDEPGATSTPGQESTATPGSENTSTPAPPSTPAPTATPRPINPHACIPDEENPNYCTPTPGP